VLHHQRRHLRQRFALASASAELRLANGVTLIAKFDGEFSGHSSTYAGTGTDGSVCVVGKRACLAGTR
jgi:hypothetical protein